MFATKPVELGGAHPPNTAQLPWEDKLPLHPNPHRGSLWSPRPIQGLWVGLSTGRVMRGPHGGQLCVQGQKFCEHALGGPPHPLPYRLYKQRNSGPCPIPGWWWRQPAVSGLLESLFLFCVGQGLAEALMESWRHGPGP